MVLGIRGMPNVQGGVETHAEQLYTRLADLGCDVEAIVRSSFIPSDVHSFGSIKLRRLWAPPRPGLEALLHTLLGVVFAGILRPDILHLHAIGPAIVTPLARLMGLRVVVTHHGPDYERDKWGIVGRLVLRTGERWGMKYANARIAISTNISDLIRESYKRSSYVIPNGVVAMQPSGSSEHLEHFGLARGRYFLQVARIVAEKRQSDLIEAFARVRPRGWRLALVGSGDEGDYTRSVRQAAAENDVVMTGFQSGEVLRQLYSHAGAFVLPSSHEGLPIALLEALNFGLPVIASAIPANLEVGLPDSAYFPVGDIATMSARLAEVARKPFDEDARGRRRDLVRQKYDWDRIAVQTLAVYEAVQQSRSP